MQIKQKPVEKFNARAFSVGIVVSQFNVAITKTLLDSAMKALKDYNVAAAKVKVITVPGAMEIPYALHVLAKTKKYNCLVALGCVIRGETPHFDYVCKMAQEGVLRVSLDNHIPIGFGVMTVNTMKQAKARPHLGAEAAQAALLLANL